MKSERGHHPIVASKPLLLEMESRVYDAALQSIARLGCAPPDASGHPFCTFRPADAESIIVSTVLAYAGSLNSTDERALRQTISQHVQERSNGDDFTVFGILAILKIMCINTPSEQTLLDIDRKVWMDKQRDQNIGAAAPVLERPRRDLWGRGGRGRAPADAAPTEPQEVQEERTVSRLAHEGLRARLVKISSEKKNFRRKAAYWRKKAPWDLPFAMSSPPPSTRTLRRKAGGGEEKGGRRERMRRTIRAVSTMTQVRK
eukprot:2150652-Pyramimonas_sp.AAC.1